MKTWIKIAVAALLIAILLAATDWRQVVVLLANSSFSLTVAAIFLSILGLLLSAQRWHLLLGAFQTKISLGLAVKLYWIGNFFSNYLPTNIGGDVVRAVMAKPYCSLSQTAASIVVERVTGLAVLLVLAGLAVFARPSHYSLPGLIELIWLCIGGMGAAIVLLMTMGERIAEWLGGFVSSGASILTKPAEKLYKLVKSVNEYHRKRALVFFALLLSVPFYISVVVFQFVLIAAVGGELGLLEVLFVAPLIPLVSLIPASINSIGIAEGAFVALYSQAGLTPEQALAAALLRRIVLLVVSLFGGAFWLSTRKRENSIA